MGDRLVVKFDTPSDCAALPFPPFSLSTLTENAVEHGLNPSPEGGSIEISARAVDGQLKVCVADSGVAFRASSGTGTGPANLRARLDAVHGDAANLRLEANAPRGIRATIAVPLRASEASAIG